MGWLGSTRKRSRFREEVYTRQLHWVREWRHARSDPWPILEHWATEHTFSLVALRGKRRLYRKGDNPAFFTTFLEFKQNEDRVTLSAWIAVGFVARFLSFFLLKTELPISPAGYLGVRVRRQACRDINSLLMRFRQQIIYGSDTFHLGDLDPTTLALGCLLLMPAMGYLVANITKLEVVPGLSNSLLFSLGKHLSLLCGVAALLLFVHDFFAVKRFGSLPMRVTSMVVGMILFVVLSIYLATRTATEMVETKLTFYCVHWYHSRICPKLLDEMSRGTRLEVLNKLQNLYQELSLRNPSR